MVNKLTSTVAFIAATLLGVILGSIVLLGILRSIPNVTERLEYYD